MRVYEYGMSHTMQALLPDGFLVNSHDREMLRCAFLHIVRQHCPNSYLLRGVELPELESLHINLSMQVKRYERLAKIRIEDLRPLSGLYLVETKECDMLSEVTPEMAGILGRMGVRVDEAV